MAIKITLIKGGAYLFLASVHDLLFSNFVLHFYLNSYASGDTSTKPKSFLFCLLYWKPPYLGGKRETFSTCYLTLLTATKTYCWHAFKLIVPI
jgi:hypothetical protein